MRSINELRYRVVDGPSSLGAVRRSRRWDWLQATFPKIESMSVIDLGGTMESWLRAPIRPASVHVVNLDPPPLEIPDWIRADQADACRLPARIATGSYDLVFSNSVIEHVGGHAERMRFADTVHRLADRHWVQTPYRYFPVEPHWLFPRVPVPALGRARRGRQTVAVGQPTIIESRGRASRGARRRTAQPVGDGLLFPCLGAALRAHDEPDQVNDRRQAVACAPRLPAGPPAAHGSFLRPPWPRG